MLKPDTREGYKEAQTLDCERLLVTLLRGLGPWKDSVFLVGGLAPRYIIRERPPKVPAHAGTQDVDVVIDLKILTDTEAYATLEDNLKRLNFERAENAKGQKISWRWQTRTEHGALMLLELLTDAPEVAGGKVRPLPTEGTISALNIPHSSIVFDMYETVEITAELLGGGGIATVTIKHADVVSSHVSKYSHSTIASNAKMPKTCCTALRTTRGAWTQLRIISDLRAVENMRLWCNARPTVCDVISPRTKLPTDTAKMGRLPWQNSSSAQKRTRSCAKAGCAGSGK